jgi:hypothetical protein
VPLGGFFVGASNLENQLLFKRAGGDLQTYGHARL